MQRALSKLLFVGLSLCAGSCGSGPKVTVCISDPANLGFQCVGHDDKAFFLPFAQSDNYVALPPDDMRSLVEYCGLSSRSQAIVMARGEQIQAIAADASKRMYEAQRVAKP